MSVINLFRISNISYKGVYFTRNQYAVDILPDESFIAILRHLSEQDRIRMLCTCKKMRKWLRKRQDNARAAFHAFKAKCLKDGWRRENDLTVCLSATENGHVRTVHWSETVCLQEIGLISIRSTESVMLQSGMTLPSLDTTRFFTPWFRVMTTSPPWRYPRTERTDMIREILRQASPRLA
jgi:hypothetical protein